MTSEAMPNRPADGRKSNERTSRDQTAAAVEGWPAGQIAARLNRPLKSRVLSDAREFLERHSSDMGSLLAVINP